MGAWVWRAPESPRAMLTPSPERQSSDVHSPVRVAALEGASSREGAALLLFASHIFQMHVSMPAFRFIAPPVCAMCCSCGLLRRRAPVTPVKGCSDQLKVTFVTHAAGRDGPRRASLQSCSRVAGCVCGEQRAEWRFRWPEQLSSAQLLRPHQVTKLLL